MTREEAITIFKGFKFLPREMKAVDMAIKALEQEPTTKNDLADDCISRAQTQIEIEMNASRYTIAKERGGMGQVEWSDQLIKVSDAVDIIRQMPPVTPQEPTAKNCESCRYYGLHHDVCNYCYKCSLWTEQESRWIPVSERLPKKNVEVLATTIWGAVTIAEMFSANDWLIHEGATNAGADDIVAWMPLPKPYKAESEVEHEHMRS